MPELRPSAGALFRLIPWTWMLGIGCILTFWLVEMALGRESERFLPAVSMQDGAWLWLAAFLISAASGLVCAYGTGRLRSSETIRMLPALEGGLRQGLAILAVVHCAAGGITALALGHGVLDAAALAAFSGVVFLVWSWVTTWLERRFGSSSPWTASSLLPLPVAWVFIPALPGRLGAATPLATVVISLALSVVLLRFVPLLGPRGNTGEGGEWVDVEREEEAGAERTATSLTGWVRTPVLSGLRFWWLQLAGRGLGWSLLGLQAVLAFAFVWTTVSVGHWLFLLFVMVLARIGPLPAPMGSLSIPMSRTVWARIAWMGELIQSWAFVAAATASLVLISVLAPDAVAAVSGPHPALILGALVVCLPLNGAIDMAMGVHSSTLALGRRMVSRFMVLALAVGLVLLLDSSPSATAGYLLLGAGFAGAATGFLLVRHHLARCPLGPSDA